jgi:chemosensory pili system protein ChpE/L-lysine exporter family protein LysE/ArgO
MTTDHLTLFLTALGLGFVFNAAPGAVFVETVRQGVRGGFRPAFAVQVGSLVGDTLWAVIGLAGVALLLSLESLRVPIGVAGVLYLLWLARDAWRTAHREFSVDGSRPPAHPGHALRAGVLLSVTNPQNIAYFAAIGTGMAAVIHTRPTVADYAIFFAGLTAASVAWSFICAALVDRVFRNASLRWARFTYRACAVLFLALALSTLRELVRTESSTARTTAPAAHGKP